MGSDVNSNTSPHFDFGDRRLFLVQAGPASAVCGVYADESEAFHQQSEDSPQHIVVGKNAPEDKCRRLAKRFGVNEEELLAFRDGARECVEFIATRPASSGG